MLDLGEEAGTILPSEVRRTRLHAPQKGLRNGAMMPISPNTVGETYSDGRSRWLRGRQIAERHYAADALHNLSERHHDSGVHKRSSSRGMNSMKRTTTSSSAGEAGKAFDLVVVEAAQQNAVDLEG